LNIPRFRAGPARMHWGAGALLIASPLVLAGPTFQFHIQAEPAKEGLQEFARQAHLQLVMDPRQVAGLHTRAVDGELEVAAGLAQLLGDTKIDVQLDPSGSRLLVNPPEMPAAPLLLPPPDLRRASGDLPRQEAGSEAVHAAESTVTITGNYIPNVKPVGELLVISGEKVRRSGVLTVGEYLRQLPQVFRGGPSPMSRGTDAESQSNSGLGECINLRALGCRASVVLVDGIRVAPSGNAASFADTLNIPIVALDRVEILLDGASSIYGADAVGGVVNFILLSPGAATETLLQGASVTQGSLRQAQLGQVLSHSWSSGGSQGRGLLVGQVTWQSPLKSIDRPYLSSDQRPYGGLNQDSRASNPGTLIAGGHTYRMPSGATNVSSSWIPDTENLIDSAQNAQVIPGQRMQSILGKVDQNLGDRWALHVEFLGTYRSVSQENGGATASLYIPPTNPFYFDPSGGPGPVFVERSFIDFLGPVTTWADVFTSLSSVQLEREIGQSSKLTMSFSYVSEEEHQHVRGEYNPDAVTAALADIDPTRALNVYGSGPRTNPQTLAALERIPRYRSLSTESTVTVKFNGELGTWWGGTVKEAIGLETRGRRFDTAWTDGLTPTAYTRFCRSLAVGFGQLDFPIFSQANARPGARQLNLSFAARFEDYSRSVHSWTPTVGLLWRPTERLRLTVKSSKSFRVPSAGDVDTTQNATLIAPWLDLTAPQSIRTVLLASGSNPDLKEERATSRAVAVGWFENGSDENASHIEATYFDDNFYSRILTPVLSPQALANVLNDPALQYLVVRNPDPSLRNEVCTNGQLSGGDRAACSVVDTLIDVRLRNAQALKVRGIDLDAQLALHPTWGLLLWDLKGAYLLNYDAINAPDSPSVSFLNHPGNPVNLKLQSAVRADLGGLSAAITLNYINHYTNTLVEPARSVASWTTFDFQLSHTWSGHARDGSALELGLAVRNVFDRDPPVVLDPIQMIAYDPTNTTAWGRVISLRLDKRW